MYSVMKATTRVDPSNKQTTIAGDGFPVKASAVVARLI